MYLINSQKPNYTPEDLELLKYAVDKIKTAFPKLYEITTATRKGLFRSKGTDDVWTFVPYQNQHKR